MIRSLRLARASQRHGAGVLALQAAALCAVMGGPGCTVFSVADTAASVAVHAVGAAADVAIDAASVAGKVVTTTAGAAVDGVKAVAGAGKSGGEAAKDAAAAAKPVAP